MRTVLGLVVVVAVSFGGISACSKKDKLSKPIPANATKSEPKRSSGGGALTFGSTTLEGVYVSECIDIQYQQDYAPFRMTVTFYKNYYYFKTESFLDDGCVTLDEDNTYYSSEYSATIGADVAKPAGAKELNSTYKKTDGSTANEYNIISVSSSGKLNILDLSEVSGGKDGTSADKRPETFTIGSNPGYIIEFSKK